MVTKDSDLDNFLNELVKDCIIYRLNLKEALSYVKIRSKHEIKERNYRTRRANLLNDNAGQVWLNYFTRTGFVLHHKQQMEIIEKIQTNALKQLFIEAETKEPNEKNQELIIKLNYLIAHLTKLHAQFGMETPLISRIKARVENTQSRYDELVKKVRKFHPELLNEITK